MLFFWLIYDVANIHVELISFLFVYTFTNDKEMKTWTKIYTDKIYKYNDSFASSEQSFVKNKTKQNKKQILLIILFYSNREAIREL